MTFQAEEVHVAVFLWEAVEQRGAVLSRHIPDHSPLKHGRVQASVDFSARGAILCK